MSRSVWTWVGVLVLSGSLLRDDKMMKCCTLAVEVWYDDDVTDAESVSDAMDILMDNAKSTPNVLDEIGHPTVHSFRVLIEGDV